MSDPPDPPDPSPARVGPVLQALSVAIVGVLPAFLVGALAVQLRADLGMSLAGIGLATATLFAVSGSLARVLGALVQRLGSRRGMTLAGSLSTLSLVGVGLAPSPPALLAALVVGGVGNAVAQPAANLRLSELVREGRLGLAFGVKQSAIPVATLLGGLAVPGIALVVGWRWALAAAAVLGVIVVVTASLYGRTARPQPLGEDDVTDRGLPRRGLLVLTIGAGLGAAASTSLGIFLVDSGVAAGLAPGTSGLLFAGCSLLGLIGRIGFGALADRHPTRSTYLFIAGLLAWGAVGYLLLALGQTWTFAAGSVLAYGAGWSWPGLFHFAIVKDNRRAAASATGFVQTGLSLGAGGGPLGFGFLVEATSYRTAWLVAAALSVVAAVTIRTGRRLVRRSRGLPVIELRRRRRSGDRPDLSAPARVLTDLFPPLTGPVPTALQGRSR